MIDIISWFLFHRWSLIFSVNELAMHGYQPNRADSVLKSLHNNNVASCREHECIYNDMCKIVRGAGL